MASELLAVPEYLLLEVIEIIRTGLKHYRKTTSDTKELLIDWCDEEEAYIKGMGDVD